MELQARELQKEIRWDSESEVDLTVPSSYPLGQGSEAWPPKNSGRLRGVTLGGSLLGGHSFYYGPPV